MYHDQHCSERKNKQQHNTLYKVQCTPNLKAKQYNAVVVNTGCLKL